MSYHVCFLYTCETHSLHRKKCNEKTFKDNWIIRKKKAETKRCKVRHKEVFYFKQIGFESEFEQIKSWCYGCLTELSSRFGEQHKFNGSLERGREKRAGSWLVEPFFSPWEPIIFYFCENHTRLWNANLDWTSLFFSVETCLLFALICFHSDIVDFFFQLVHSCIRLGVLVCHVYFYIIVPHVKCMNNALLWYHEHDFNNFRTSFGQMSQKSHELKKLAR